MKVIGLFKDGKSNDYKLVSRSVSLEDGDTIGDIAAYSKFTITEVKEIIKNKYLDEDISASNVLSDYMTIVEVSRYCRCTVDDLIKQIQKDIINNDNVDNVSKKAAEYCVHDVEATITAWDNMKNIKRMTPEQETYILRFFEALRKHTSEHGCSDCILCNRMGDCIGPSEEKICDLLRGFFYENK